TSKTRSRRQAMSELKPCPFCDGESVSIRMVRLNRRSGYRASCNGCGTTQGGIVHPSLEAAKEARNRRADPEQQAEPVAAPAGYFCEPYLNKPGLFEQVFNGFDDPDVIPLYRDPNGRIAALEREVEELRGSIAAAANRAGLAWHQGNTDSAVFWRAILA